MVAFSAVLLLGILNGVLVAVVVSMLLLIRRAAHPHVAILGRIPGTRIYSDMERNPDNEAIPDVRVFRVEASLLYFNVEHVRAAVWQRIRSAAAPVRLVIWDLSTSPAVDLAGARMLAALHTALKAEGIDLRLVAAHAKVRDMLRAEGLEDRVGYFGRRVSVADAIEAFQRGTEMDIPAEAKTQVTG
ncbi:STAS domain-containing protein [Cupriavidus basilensis]